MFNTAKKLDKLIKFLGLEIYHNYIEKNPDMEDRQIVDRRSLDRLREDFGRQLQTLSNDIIEDRKKYLELADHIQMLKDFLNVEMVPYLGKEPKVTEWGDLIKKDIIKYKYVKKTAKF